jgi:hypothetical protein
LLCWEHLRVACVGKSALLDRSEKLSFFLFLYDFDYIFSWFVALWLTLFQICLIVQVQDVICRRLHHGQRKGSVTELDSIW